jgi:hypothetical protein
MKDLFSSFDRFAASLATGVLLLYGSYLIISSFVPYTYEMIDSLLQRETAKAILGLPLLVTAYLVGTVNAILSGTLFLHFWKNYRDEYWILDDIERRGHAILSKEAADLINAKRLILASALPFCLVGIGWLLDRNRWGPDYATFRSMGGILSIIAGLSTPLWAMIVHSSLRAMHNSLKRECPETPTPLSGG